jgi:hypothetical protein
MAEVFSLSERHLPESLREQAAASNNDAIGLFKERLQAVSEWSESVPSGNEEQALVYAVNEIWRVEDDAEGNQMVTDSRDGKQTEEGRFDLRENTK